MLLDVFAIDGTRADHDVDAFLHCHIKKLVEFFDGGRQIGIREQYIFARRGKYTLTDRITLASISTVLYEPQPFNLRLSNDFCRIVDRPIIDNDALKRKLRLPNECIDLPD